MITHDRDDIALLLPCFQPYVRYVKQALVERGFHPVVWDTLRTQAEANANAKRGTGSKNSMHMHGVAVDFICGEHMWGCQAEGCGFFEALQEIGKALGLVCVHIKGHIDWPHLQCVSVADQNAVRRLKTWDAKDRFVATRLQPLPQPLPQ